MSTVIKRICDDDDDDDGLKRRKFKFKLIVKVQFYLLKIRFVYFTCLHR